mmetsp:Transcript_53165/g.95413  ORF Transcript_53165/g.95413 Transcript_53165/m.95413 type:complete len:544 (+) Transcript_53165:81-1712(+)|eukprot:CAMPEP_0197651034 /NCGR_PEP_ID=MMETSP1338-20131121/31307_1 /TAXON_ID=43686 ORGANISM="Pelagodinium beii, Strain RCC1491" /NCGR_SAMPLE_ID=MMETSP1338 /ASSEMBLY_ACC=CAM_ASM_000754 /LENGTH=543 /DNA_ID=CAMNT_0043225575 /DNA_START=76 /DNA_END=1707 /DNA_ORIENTATION=+
MAPKSKRTDSPAPKATPSPEQKRKRKSVGGGNEDLRKLTRPQGEFYGNIGTGFWTFFIPVAIYYFYGIMVMHEGRLVIPDASFWKDLIWSLPDGLSIRPCWGPTAVSLTWVALQALGEMILPGQIKDGVKLKNDRCLPYPMNGLLCFFLSHVGVYLACHYGIIKPYYVYLNMGALLTEAVITSYVMALWLYIDYGIFWERHVNDPEFEEDHGVFNLKDMPNDFFMGVVRNPRLFQGILKVPFDLKRFWNARPGLTGWVILNISYLFSIYYGCKLPSAYSAGESRFFGDHEGKSATIQKLFASDPSGYCNEVGDLSNIGPAAVFITLAHWYYILDYNIVEPAYLTTTDIRHDLFGFMLTYGDWGFLSRFYPITFMGFLAHQGSSSTGFITDNYFYAILGVLMYMNGMLLFRITNIEKHLFRDHMNSGGTADKYRSPWSTRIFFGDKKPEYIKTKEGSLLLCSGFWGLARHFNYVGDLSMCIGWAVVCYDPKAPFPWLPLAYCTYFWLMDCHRCWRDEVRCSKKYGDDWIRYKQAVPYAIVPGIW